MGQKVNSNGFRTGVKGCNRTWDSKWFNEKNYADTFLEDLKINNFLKKEYSHTKIGKIEIERSGNHLKVIVHSAMPGVLIGKKGSDIENLRKILSNIIKKDNVEVSIQEIKDPFLCAAIVAQGVAEQIEKRVSFKRAIKKAAADILRAGATGVKIRAAGRLDGAEIARDEWVRIGSVPLHTLRADIDYGFHEADTTYGKIGIKVWICRGQYRNFL